MSEPPRKKRPPETPGQVPQQRSSQANQAEETWVESVLQWFPDLHTQTYTVPTLYFRRVASSVELVAGQKVSCLKQAPREIPKVAGASVGRKRQRKKKSGGDAAQTSQRADETPAGQVWQPNVSDEDAPRVFDSDVRDDKAQELVIFSLQHMGRKQGEVMVVVSQLRFGKYLDEPAYAAAAEEFPRPVTLDPKYEPTGTGNLIELCPLATLPSLDRGSELLPGDKTHH